MAIDEAQIGKLEARVRALEAIINQLPQVFTEQVFDAAHQQVLEPYRHPDSIGAVTIAEEADLAGQALDEIERFMRDSPAG